MTLEFALDLEGCVGDPRRDVDPVALFGRFADAAERRVHAGSKPRGAPAHAFVAGIGCGGVAWLWVVAKGGG